MTTTLRSRPKSSPALKRATCAALIAATFAVPVSAESISSIERYCTSSWRQAGIPLHEWEDCTQDTMLELLSRVPKNRLSSAIDRPESSERRELMRSIWCVAQRWRRATHRRPVSLDAVGEWHPQTDDADVPENYDKEALLQALRTLNSTQQKILQMYCDGNSIAEISTELDLSPARVSDQKYKAVRELKKQLSSVS